MRIDSIVERRSSDHRKEMSSEAETLMSPTSSPVLVRTTASSKVRKDDDTIARSSTGRRDDQDDDVDRAGLDGASRHHAGCRRSAPSDQKHAAGSRAGCGVSPWSFAVERGQGNPAIADLMQVAAFCNKLRLCSLRQILKLPRLFLPPLQ